jgi:hypothetical protein
LPASPEVAGRGEGYVYFDEVLYKRRNVIEQACAWLDSFTALVIRFEKAIHWVALHSLAFTVLFIRKIIKIERL